MAAHDPRLKERFPNPLISTCGVSFGDEAEVEEPDGIPPHDPRKKLVVSDVLEHGAEDLPPVLEQSLVVPMGIRPGESVHDSVVFPEENGVQGAQAQLLVQSVVP